MRGCAQDATFGTRTGERADDAQLKEQAAILGMRVMEGVGECVKLRAGAKSVESY